MDSLEIVDFDENGMELVLSFSDAISVSTGDEPDVLFI